MLNPRKSSKRFVAMNIYTKNAGRVPRKDVIAMMVKDAELTDAGAATYYQTFKTEGVPQAPQPKKMGRPAGSKNAVKGKRAKPASKEAV